MRSPSLQKAIEALGGVVRLAAAVGVTPSAVSQWRWTPATRVLQIERASGISRHELRPDIYPPADAAASAPDRALSEEGCLAADPAPGDERGEAA